MSKAGNANYVADRKKYLLSLTPEMKALYEREARLELEFARTDCQKKREQIRAEYMAVVERLQKLFPPDKCSKTFRKNGRGRKKEILESKEEELRGFVPEHTLHLGIQETEGKGGCDGLMAMPNL